MIPMARGTHRVHILNHQSPTLSNENTAYGDDREIYERMACDLNDSRQEFLGDSGNTRFWSAVDRFQESAIPEK